MLNILEQQIAPNLNRGKLKVGHYTERRLISHDKALVCVKITTRDD